jgi:hypothetical protein
VSTAVLSRIAHELGVPAWRTLGANVWAATLLLEREFAGVRGDRDS